MEIRNILLEYNKKLDNIDLELIIARVFKKPREFVLAHPEHKLTKKQESAIKRLVKRRLNQEPIAYILEQKEFYGLDFKVTPDTLIPRPETELLVDEGLDLLRSMLRNKVAVIDIGTGSGNIIISIAKATENLQFTCLAGRRAIHNLQLIGTDISEKALRVAKLNAKRNNVEKKIKFIKSDLLDYFLKNKKELLKIDNCKLIIVSNLPYLSKKIYSSTMPDVKNYEPKSALLSKKYGLNHYEKLFKQLLELKNSCLFLHASCFIEFSSEQKPKIQKMIGQFFPKAKARFKKDLAGKWRLAAVEI